MLFPVRWLNIKINDASNSPFLLFVYWKNVTLCLSSLLIMMNWSSSHPLHHTYSLSLFLTRFHFLFLLYSPDAMSDNVPILSSFFSYHQRFQLFYTYMMRVYLHTFYLPNLSLSWTSPNFCFYSDEPLIHFNQRTKSPSSSTCHHYILVHARTFTSSKYVCIYIYIHMCILYGQKK